MTKTDNTRFLAADVANLEAEIDALLAAFLDLQEDETLRADMLDGETNLGGVLTRLLGHEREAASMVTAIKKRADELDARKKRQERRQAAMRALMLRLMKAASLPNVPLTEATISVTKGRDSVEIVDETAVPARFLKVVKTPDKTAIKAALDAGKKVKGAAIKTGDDILTVRAA
ncbi:siphovirus Gp157 family protein [Rhizobium sp. CBN3]|uniref:siphovirus Gp157 family protein n=1 Tax=Rhizobium sp. CBN3 TaxID=3058045 RepID=UPI0026727037|nr:siphovirus Gp157 family protein [Rhizobium sp. CBN3]MDO3431163.1 siphovirus Gp157 family protein [Rhizobium sp. CBN3]